LGDKAMVVSIVAFSITIAIVYAIRSFTYHVYYDRRSYL
jgi:hypothetical protein